MRVVALVLTFLCACGEISESPPAPIAGSQGSDPGLIGGPGDVGGIDAGPPSPTVDGGIDGGATTGGIATAAMTVTTGFDVGGGGTGIGTAAMTITTGFDVGGGGGTGIGTGAMTVTTGIEPGSPGPVTTDDGQDPGDDERVLVAGTIFDGAGGWPLPLACEVRLYEPASVDPFTGVGSGFATRLLIEVEDFPQDYELRTDTVQGRLVEGDLAFVQIVCDENRDGVLDAVGGWFPALPAEVVQLPAENVDLSIGMLPFAPPADAFG